jgi:hypothetical protein
MPTFMSLDVDEIVNNTAYVTDPTDLDAALGLKR